MLKFTSIICQKKIDINNASRLNNPILDGNRRMKQILTQIIKIKKK